MPPLPPAVVLVSGGLDSAVTLAIARAEGHATYALSFRYGQRHVAEVAAAERVARHGGAVAHRILDLDLRVIGGSALTADIDVPKHRSLTSLSQGIPVTYVPARNTVFLSIALAWAEVLGATAIYFGANAVDYSGYPDCRPDFVRAFEELANVATRMAVEDGKRLRVHAPLLALSKADIVRRGIELNLDFSLTSSCYDPDDVGTACGACDSCQIRLNAFRQAGLLDPIPYRQDRS